MPLSALAIQNAKPKAKLYKLSDGDGLHLAPAFAREASEGCRAEVQRRRAEQTAASYGLASQCTSMPRFSNFVRHSAQSRPTHPPDSIGFESRFQPHKLSTPCGLQNR